MIKGLYETHLFVKELKISVDFYKNKMGLEQCYYDIARGAAFFWIGAPKEAMLGLWERPKHKIDIRHFAFRCDKEDILNKSVNFLREKGLNAYNFLNNGSEMPMVFAWMPAISIYFKDPDGHELEFIAILDGKPRPELGVIPYEKWVMSQE